MHWAYKGRTLRKKLREKEIYDCQEINKNGAKLTQDRQFFIKETARRVCDSEIKCRKDNQICEKIQM